MISMAFKNELQTIKKCWAKKPPWKVQNGKWPKANNNGSLKVGIGL
jgi:hypothetical protein